MGGTICNFSTQLKFLFGYDDALDVINDAVPPSIPLGTNPTLPQQIFATHAIGGVVGNLLTALFAQSSVAGFDGITQIPGGWLDHHYIQLAYQLADSAAGMSYSFVMTVSNFYAAICLVLSDTSVLLFLLL